MKRKKLSKRFAAIALAFATAVTMPLMPANLQKEVRASSEQGTSELDTSEMTEKEKEAYELTQYYSKHLSKNDTRVKIDPNYFRKIPKSEAQKGEEIPQSYNSGRVKKNVSSVKDQDCTGLCWDFSFQEAAQDSLRAKGKATNPDFAETELGYFIYNKPVDRMGLLEGDGSYVDSEVGTYDYYETGGNALMVMLAVAQGMSFKDESTAPFTDLIDGLHTSGIYTVPDSNCYRNNLYYLSGAEVYNIYDESVRDEIKQKIMEYGAGQTAYTQNSGSLDYSTFAFYTSPEVTTEASGQHAVAIVGWDDNYSVDNFRYAPEHKGAWLIKNSWGEDWGLDGYFWMSYDEPTLQNQYLFFYDLEETVSFDNIYQYDGSLLYDSIPSDAGVMTTANIYTAQQNETLNAVSFFTAEDDVESYISIYKNPEEGNPTSGELVYSLDKPSYAKHMGYTKLDIPEDNMIKLTKGDTFSIVVKQTEKSEARPAAVLIDKDSDWYWIRFKNAAQPGQSFISMKSSDWTKEDWEDASEMGTNLRIKAFTTVNDAATGSELSFDRDEYEVVLGESVDTDVRIDGSSIKDSAKLSFESADESIAFVNDMGKIYGRKIGTTEITVKYGDKTKTAKVSVSKDQEYDSIQINKKDGYATEESPIEVKLGGKVALEFTTVPSIYSGKEIFNVEAADGSGSVKDAYEIPRRGIYKFHKAGKYKITVTVDGDNDLKGASQEFYINAVIASKDCSENVTEIYENPYECEATKIYRYNGNGSGYSFKMNYDIEEEFDYMYVFGSNDPDISDQEFYDFYRAESAKLRKDNYDIAVEDYDEDDVVLVETLTGKQSDYILKVPYKYVVFILYTDMYEVGSYEVRSVDSYSPTEAESISMKAADMSPSVKIGETADYQITVAPEEATDSILCCESDNPNTATANYDEKTGKLSITGNKIGTADIYLYIDSNDKKDAKLAEDAVDGTVTGRALKIKVNITTETEKPDSFVFTDSKLEIERNTTQQVKFNSDEWLNYDIEYDNPDPTICYINNGEIVAVSTGETKIKATVNAGLGDANPTAELTVTVKAPDTDSIENLQTIHNIVPGMDETYTYKASSGTECMKLYFDGRTSFRDSDIVIIKDGNGNYYGLDDKDRVITTTDNIETEEAMASETYYDYFLSPIMLTDYAYVIYDDEVNIRFISNDASNNNSDPDDIYRGKSYGFKVRKIETGKPATGIEIENSDIALDFSTYNSNIARIKTKLIPEDAIDNLCYEVDDSGIAKIDRYGSIKGLKEGETEFSVYTSNPNSEERVSAKGKIKVTSKEVKSLVFMDAEGNECEKDVATDIFVSPGEESCFYIRIDPWNMRNAYSFDYDRSSFLIYEDISDIGSKFHFVAPEKEGIYPVDVKMSVKNTEGKYEEKIIKIYNVNVLLGPDDVPNGFETFKAKKFKNDANDDKEPEEITAEDISLSNIPGNRGYFTYKKQGAEYVEITFTEDSEIGAGADWIFIYDLEGKLVGAYTGDNTIVSEYGYAGKTIRIEGEGFILGYKGDNSGTYNGFQVASINAHVPENGNGGEDDKTTEKPTEKITEKPTEKTTEKPTDKATDIPTEKATENPVNPVPVSPAKPGKTAPKVGSVVKVGKARYKILSKTAVAYAGTTVKNPKSVTIPAAVKINGKKYKVTAINANALKNKKSLKKLVIGANVERIGKNAFYGCKNLKTIIIKSNALKKVETNAIKNIQKNAVIKVPAKKLNKYKKLFTAKTGYKKNTMTIKK